MLTRSPRRPSRRLEGQRLDPTLHLESTRAAACSARHLRRPEQLVLLFADDVDLDLDGRLDDGPAAERAPTLAAGLRALCEDELDGATISLDDL